jgi:hypothetical protein
VRNANGDIHAHCNSDGSGYSYGNSDRYGNGYGEPNSNCFGNAAVYRDAKAAPDSGTSPVALLWGEILIRVATVHR